MTWIHAQATSESLPARPTTQTAAATEEGRRLLAARVTAGQKWKDVREVKVIESSRLRRLLPKAGFFCVSVFNPISVIAGRPTLLHTLVSTPEGDTFIETDADACRLLSEAGVRPADPMDALNVAMMLGELRNYSLETKPVFARPEKATPNNWNITIEEGQDGWIVSCAFMTDPKVGASQRYHITMSREGTLIARAGDSIGGFGGYR